MEKMNKRKSKALLPLYIACNYDGVTKTTEESEEGLCRQTAAAPNAIKGGVRVSTRSFHMPKGHGMHTCVILAEDANGGGPGIWMWIIFGAPLRCAMYTRAAACIGIRIPLACCLALSVFFPH